jgi:hypothetical protein
MSKLAIAMATTVALMSSARRLVPNICSTKLRGKIPTTILLGHRTDEIVRPGHSLQGTDASLEDALDE